MTHEEKIIERAREIARLETGRDDSGDVIRVLARMVAAATDGVTAGFLRLSPNRQVKLDIDDHKPL